jgi:hypothetical protein
MRRKAGTASQGWPVILHRRHATRRGSMAATIPFADSGSEGRVFTPGWPLPIRRRTRARFAACSRSAPPTRHRALPWPMPGRLADSSRAYTLHSEQQAASLSDLPADAQRELWKQIGVLRDPLARPVSPGGLQHRPERWTCRRTNDSPPPHLRRPTGYEGDLPAPRGGVT